MAECIEEKKPHPGGRPTKYKPEYCEKLIRHFSQGWSYESFAAEVDVCIDTLYEWESKYPEFSEAKKRGIPKSIRWWEEVGRDGIQGIMPLFRSTPWIFTMKCRFHHYGWKEPMPPKNPEEDNKRELPELLSETKQLVTELEEIVKNSP